MGVGCSHVTGFTGAAGAGGAAHRTLMAGRKLRNKLEPTIACGGGVGTKRCPPKAETKGGQVGGLKRYLDLRNSDRSILGAVIFALVFVRAASRFVASPL
jgi:hypothetical protein